MTNVKNSFGCIFFITIGIIQIMAVLGALQDWLGIPKLITWFIAAPIAFTPIIGSIVAIMGAIKSFKWSVFGSVIIFGAPIFISATIWLALTISDYKTYRRNKRPLPFWER